MIEQEIKFFIPEKRAKDMDILFKDSPCLFLHAQYFDTPHADLKKNGIALRIRKEGDRWIQTLKAHAQQEISKIELNHEGKENQLQIEVYKNTPFYSLLKTHQSELTLCYESLIERRLMSITHNNSVIEIAYDLGQVRCNHLSHPIRELEFELKSGQLCDLMGFSDIWQKKHTLYLEFRSKAYKGSILNEIAHHTNPTDSELDKRRAQPMACKVINHKQLKALYQKELYPKNLQTFSKEIENQYIMLLHTTMIEQYIKNVALNVNLYLNIDEVKSDCLNKDLLIQYIRTGIRYILSNLELFKHILPTPKKKHIKPLIQTYKLLGQHRDQWVLKQEIIPILNQEGIPHKEWSFKELEPLEPLLEQLHGALFQLLTFIYTTPIKTPKCSIYLSFKDRLGELYQQKKSFLKDNEKPTLQQYHQLRKDIRLLRYGMKIFILINQGRITHHKEVIKSSQNIQETSRYLAHFKLQQLLLGQIQDRAKALKFFKKQSTKQAKLAQTYLKIHIMLIKKQIKPLFGKYKNWLSK